MAKQDDFIQFLKNIEPSQSTVQYISSVQNTLREYLKNHNYYKNIYIDSFLSGSYAKHTSIRPVKNDSKRDVDIIVVTSYDVSKDSKYVLEELMCVLQESSNYKNVTVQHHSVGIEMDKIGVDVVPVICDDFDENLYYIGDSENGFWSVTDPKGHKAWATSINQNNNNMYKPLVKIFKWWRRVNCPPKVKFPKGIALEKLLADNLGNSTASIEDYIIETMENIVCSYSDICDVEGSIPFIDDPSEKIDGSNLLEEYSAEDFSRFISLLDDHIRLLNDKGTENVVWREILGDEFPKDTKVKSSYNIEKCKKASHRKKMPWPYRRGGAAFIALEVRDSNGRRINYESNGELLEKRCTLYFRAHTCEKKPYIVKWQITNTGIEAFNEGCLRGDFEESDMGYNGKKEMTSYTGSHSVQCFIIKNGICVAKSQDYIINIK